jgi:microcystin-dependent protein
MKLQTKIALVFALSFAATTHTSAQEGAGIGTTNPDQSAALHVMENDTSKKGVLIPRVNLSPTPIPATTDGVLVYNKQSGFLAYSNGSAWVDIAPVPPGTIIMWNGSASNLPDGWVLCDGRKYNLQGAEDNTSGIPTPDLRGQFIAGYSGSGEYATVGAKAGGGASHVLTTAHMPSHSHGISSDHSHSVGFSPNPHTHDFTVSDAEKSTGVIAGASTAPFTGFHYTELTAPKSTSKVQTAVSVGNSTTQITVGETGSGQAIDNRPPYYVLAFIMKL